MYTFCADYIFPITSHPIKNGVVSVDNHGKITNLDTLENIKDKSRIEFLKGIICPGFINAHCHLELSHFKNMIPEKLGLPGFIKEILSKRDKLESSILPAIEQAEQEMIKNGIVAVGDICNTNHTFQTKKIKNLLYHTFIELFSLNPDEAHETFNKGKLLLDEIKPLPASLVPHAPYSMSTQLLNLINEWIGNNNAITSIHNQECEAENELFISQAGWLFNTLINVGIPEKYFTKTGKNSLESILHYMLKAKKLLLVHNTFTSNVDIAWAKHVALQHHTELYWCTCPNANLYIENKLPDYNSFINEYALITVGTDSLASNHKLCILSELKTISKYFPNIPLQNLLTWATKNGASFFDWDHLGSIEIGKTPGLNLITGVEDLKLTERAEVKKLA